MLYYISPYNVEKIDKFVNRLFVKNVQMATLKGNLVSPAEFGWHLCRKAHNPAEEKKLLGKLAGRVFGVARTMIGTTKGLSVPGCDGKKKLEYPNLLTLTEKGKTAVPPDFAEQDHTGAAVVGYLRVSYFYLLKGIEARKEAFSAMEAIASTADPTVYLINPRLYVGRAGISKAILAKRERMFKGGNSGTPETFDDRVEKKASFNVNIPKLFDPTNEGISDLKKLYAHEFNTDIGPSKKVSLGMMGPGKQNLVSQWNYEYGAATNWPDVTFGGVLPDAKDNAQFKDQLVSLSRDGSTRLLATWLRFFM